MRILLVDDDVFAAELASVFLIMSGYDVIIVASAIEALSSLDAHQDIDLVVSDLHMPDISGMELLEMLRGHGWDKPFIILSANEIADGAVRYDRWVKKDENLAETLVAAVNEIAQPAHLVG